MYCEKECVGYQLIGLEACYGCAGNKEKKGEQDYVYDISSRINISISNGKQDISICID